MSRLEEKLKNYRFDLRRLLLVCTLLSVLFAVLGHLVRRGDISPALLLYCVAILLGSASATLYSVLLDRPEPNRWLRAFAVGTLVGGLAFCPLFGSSGGMPVAVWWFMGFFVSTLPACFFASITEAMRMTIELVRKRRSV